MHYLTPKVLDTVRLDFQKQPHLRPVIQSPDQLPESVRSYVLDGGTIGNANFVAIPYNSSAKAGAMVVANFLMSPEAQIRAQDPAVLGNFTVLDPDALDAEDQAALAALDLGPATLTPEELGAALPEPHPSWMERLSRDWLQRFGVGQ